MAVTLRPAMPTLIPPSPNLPISNQTKCIFRFLIEFTDVMGYSPQGKKL